MKVCVHPPLIADGEIHAYREAPIRRWAFPGKALQGEALNIAEKFDGGGAGEQAGGGAAGDEFGDGFFAAFAVA